MLRELARREQAHGESDEIWVLGESGEAAAGLRFVGIVGVVGEEGVEEGVEGGEMMVVHVLIYK